MANTNKNEPTEGATKDIAGKGDLDDEMLPEGGKPLPQENAGGDTHDTAGKHGDMAPESADALEKKAGKKD